MFRAIKQTCWRFQNCPFSIFPQQETKFLLLTLTFNLGYAPGYFFIGLMDIWDAGVNSVQSVLSLAVIYCNVLVVR